jgi:hypothetical protein
VWRHDEQGIARKAKPQSCVAIQSRRDECVGVELKEGNERCLDVWVRAALASIGCEHEERGPDHNLKLIELQASLILDAKVCKIATIKLINQLGSRWHVGPLVD